MHRKSYLLVELDRTLHSFMVIEGEVNDSFLRHDTAFDSTRIQRIDKAIRNWAQYKVIDINSLMRVLNKHFPGFIEVPVVHQDQRLEINRIFDQGDEPHIISYYNGKPRSDFTSRLNEHGEQITKDGVPTRLCDIDGIPYPTPPEGQRRWRISAALDGASFTPYHTMWMAADPRDAALQAMAYLDTPEGSGPFGFSSHRVIQTIVSDVDSEETHFFVGPNCDVTPSGRVMGAMFSQMASDVAPDMDDALRSLGLL